jgi:hypothetical protein
MPPVLPPVVVLLVLVVVLMVASLLVGDPFITQVLVATSHV